MASHGSIVGPGGASVFDDTDAWTIFYHCASRRLSSLVLLTLACPLMRAPPSRSADYTSSGSYLGINLLDFSSGWPVAY